MPRFQLGGNAGRFLVAQHAFGSMCKRASELGINLSEQDMEIIRDEMVDTISRQQTARNLEPVGFGGLALTPTLPRNYTYFASLFRDAVLHRFGEPVNPGDEPADSRRPAHITQMVLSAKQPGFVTSMAECAQNSRNEFVNLYTRHDYLLVNPAGIDYVQAQGMELGGFDNYSDRFLQHDMGFDNKRMSEGEDVTLGLDFNAPELADVPAGSEILLYPEDPSAQPSSIGLSQLFSKSFLEPVVLRDPNQAGVRMRAEFDTEREGAGGFKAARDMLRDPNAHPEWHMTDYAYAEWKFRYAYARMADIAADYEKTGMTAEQASQIRGAVDRAVGRSSRLAGLFNIKHAGKGVDGYDADVDRMVQSFIEAHADVMGLDLSSDEMRNILRAGVTESLTEFDASLMRGGSNGPQLLVSLGSSYTDVMNRAVLAERAGVISTYGLNINEFVASNGPGVLLTAPGLNENYGANSDTLPHGVDIEQAVIDRSIIPNTPDVDSPEELSDGLSAISIDEIRLAAGILQPDPIVGMLRSYEAAEAARAAEEAARQAEVARQAEEAARAEELAEFGPEPPPYVPSYAEFEPGMGGEADYFGVAFDSAFDATYGDMGAAADMDDSMLAAMEDAMIEASGGNVNAARDAVTAQRPSVDPNGWRISEQVYQTWKAQHAFARMVDAYNSNAGTPLSYQDQMVLRTRMISALGRANTVHPRDASTPVFSNLVLKRYFNPAEDAANPGSGHDDMAFVNAFVNALPGSHDAATIARMEAALNQASEEFDGMLSKNPGNPVLLVNGVGMSITARNNSVALRALEGAGNGSYLGLRTAQMAPDATGIVSMPGETVAGAIPMWDGMNAVASYTVDLVNRRASSRVPFTQPEAPKQQPAPRQAPAQQQVPVQRPAPQSQPQRPPRQNSTYEQVTTLNLADARLREMPANFAMSMFSTAPGANGYLELTAEGRMQMDYFIRQTAYHDLVQRMNASLAERGLDASHGVTTRTASMLLDNIEGFDRLHPRDFPAALNRAIDNLPSSDSVKLLWKDTLESVTSGDNANWWEASRDKFESNLTRQNIMTLSPFDTNFRNRKIGMDKGHNLIYARFSPDLESGDTIVPLSGRLHGDNLSANFGSGWKVYNFGYNWESDSELNRLLEANHLDINDFNFDARQNFGNPDISKNPLFTEIWSKVTKGLDQAGRPVYLSEDELRQKLSFVESGFRGRQDVLLNDAEDLSGLAALRPYMSPRDYQTISNYTFGNTPWCSACTKVDENGNRVPQYMSPETIERVRKTVDMLAASGETFTFEPDVNPGQVRIRFENGMTMRVIDPANESFACNQTHHQGASMYYQVQSGSGKSYPYPNVTPEMSVDLVRFARGESVARRKDNTFNLAGHVQEVDGTVLSDTLGGVGSVRTRAGLGYGNKPGHLRQTAYRSKDNTSLNVLVDVLPLGKDSTSEKPSPDMALVINCDYKNRSASHLSFDDVTCTQKLSTGTTIDVVSKGAVRAEKYLRESIDKAWAGFDREVDIESLIEEAALVRQQEAAMESEGLDPETASPLGDAVYSKLSSNPDIAIIQNKYWDILMGREDRLLKPAYDVDLHDEDEDSVSEFSEMNGHTYDDMTPEEMVRAHVNDLKSYLIGQYEPVMQVDPENPNGEMKALRFNPNLVCRYMSGSTVSSADSKNIVAACKKLGFSVDELKYEGLAGGGSSSAFQREVARDKLTSFDEESQQNIFTGDFGSETKNAFMRSMGDAIMESLQSNACRVNPDDIMIDKNGIVRYRAKIVESQPGGEYLRADKQGHKKGDDKATATYVNFTGEIGKIYAPDEKGVVKTSRFIGIPGYQARVEPNKPGENKPYEERIVLTSYEDAMKAAIRSNIRRDLTTQLPRVEDGEVKLQPSAEGLNIRESEMTIGETFSVDHVLRNFVDVRYPLDFDDDKAMEARGLDVETRDVIIGMNRAKCKFSKAFLEASNEMPVFTALNGVNGEKRDILNDNCMDALTLSGYRNVALLESPGDGMFDPFATGNANAQGVRYLAEGATVDETGHVIPGNKDPLSREARCCIVNYLRDHGRYPDFDSPDRMNMDINSIMHCLRVAEPAGIAQLDVGMYTLEDGPVISKKYAEKNFIYDAKTGESRPIGPGDKMGCHGNKGVVSKVVDPDMPEDEAKAAGVWPLVQLFKANPNLDIVMSSYSGPARFNAGLAVECINSNPEDLVNPLTGEVHPKSIGHVSMIIMEQTADAKTHFSPDGADGRSYGAQMLWALSAKDCPEIIKTAFRTNVKASSNLREMCMTLGLDVDPTGRFEMGYHPHPGEVRNVFELPDIDLEEWPNLIDDPNVDWRAPGNKDIPSTQRTKVASRPKLQCQADTINGLHAQFDEWLNTHGGFMEIPFPLKFKSDKVLQSIEAGFNRDEARILKSVSSELDKLSKSDVALNLVNNVLAAEGKPAVDKIDLTTLRQVDMMALGGLPDDLGELKADLLSVRAGAERMAELDAQRAGFDELKASGGVGMTDVYDPVKYGRGTEPHTTHANWTRHEGTKDGPDFKDTRFEPAALAGGESGRQTYALPVMSSYLRAGQELGDGEMKAHDWTKHYSSIFENSREYMKQQASIDYLNEHKAELWPRFEATAKSWSGQKRYAYLRDANGQVTAEAVFNETIRGCQNEMETCQKKAQSSFNKIASELETRKFSGKHNIFRAGIMSNKQDHSCTAVWSADPNRGVEEVGMPKKMMDSLGVKPGDYVQIHRDPVLYGSAVRYMKSVQDDTLVGISVHPAGVPGGMQGDFDGDTIGVRAFDKKDAAARKEAMEKLSVKANLLNTRMDEREFADGSKGYPLFIGTNQDVTSGMVYGDGLRERLDEITIRVNKFERELKDNPAELDKAREAALKDINTFLADCAEASFGHNVMSYADKKSNVLCNEQIVKSGAKGKPAGVDLLARNMGVHYERDEDGNIMVDTIVEHETNIASREQLSNQLKAKNIQQQYTGIAGDNTITHEACFMNICPEEAAGLGGAVTDATLQIKHDAVKGMRFEMLMTSVTKDMTNGLKLVPTSRTVGVYDPDAPVKDSKGNDVLDPVTGEVQKGAFVTKEMPTWQRHLAFVGRDTPSYQPHAATRSEFINQLEGVYNSKEGFDVGVKHEYIETIATVLTTPDLLRQEAVGKPVSPDDAKCINMKSGFKKDFGSPLQRCAYTVTPDQLYEMAYEMSVSPNAPGLYDTPQRTIDAFSKGVVTPSGKVVGKLHNVNCYIADGSSVRRNLEMRDAALRACSTEEERQAALKDLADKYLPVVRQDTLVNGKANTPRAKLAEGLVHTAPEAQRTQPDVAQVDVGRLFDEFTNPVAEVKIGENMFEPVAVSAKSAPKSEQTRVVEHAASQPAAKSAPKPEAKPEVKAETPAPTGFNGLNLGADVLGAQPSMSTAPGGPKPEPRRYDSGAASGTGCDKPLGDLPGVDTTSPTDGSHGSMGE